MPTKLQRNKLDNFMRYTKLYEVIRKCIVNISNGFVGSQSRPLKWLGKTAPFGYFLANSRRAGITSVVSLFAILGFSLICATPDTYAAASLSISVDSASESFDLLPTASSAAFGKSGIITASITTTNYTGYNFTVTGPNASKTLVGTTSTSNTLESITSAIAESTFSSSSSYDNKWGFLPSKLNGSANSNYQPGPLNTTATVIDTTSAANSTANTYSFAIAAKVTNSVAKDTYGGSFTLATTANPAAYQITYNGNGTTTNVPTTQTGNFSSGTAIALSSATPTMTNYTFAGWCTSAVSNYSTCNGTTIAAGDSYTFSSPSDTALNSLALTAIWKLNYSVTYNASTGGSGAPSAQSGSLNYNGSFSLSSTTPTRSGFTFNGWCTVNPNGGSGCSGTPYAAGQAITLTSPLALTLYARWKAQLSAPQVTQLDYDTLSFSSTNGVAYYVSTNSTQPSASDPGWTTNTTYDIPQPEDGEDFYTYYVFTKDSNDNVSLASDPITAYKVTAVFTDRISPSGSYIKAGSQDGETIISSFTQDVPQTFYIFEDTSLYVYVSTGCSSSLTWNGTTVASGFWRDTTYTGVVTGVTSLELIGSFAVC